MICPVKHFPAPSWHRFLSMLPQIRNYAAGRFRHLKPEAQEEAIQETIANALVAFARLAELGKIDLAYPTVLARFAVAQIRSGRKVGGTLNVHDASSEYAQRKKGFHLERLDQFDADENQWQEAVVQDTRSAPVSETACFRIDFSTWLRSLPWRHRRIASVLALGHSTSDVAASFDVTPGRISQLRRELAESWKQFHGETVLSSTIPDSSAIPAA